MPVTAIKREPGSAYYHQYSQQLSTVKLSPLLFKSLPNSLFTLKPTVQRVVLWPVPPAPDAGNVVSITRTILGGKQPLSVTEQVTIRSLSPHYEAPKVLWTKRQTKRISSSPPYWPQGSLAPGRLLPPLLALKVPGAWGYQAVVMAPPQNREA